MTKLLRAAVFALACLALAAVQPAPAAAQDAQGCRPLEAILTEASEAAAAGAELHVFTGAEAQAALTFLKASLGPWPLPQRPETIILAIGPHAALLAFGEGIQVCVILPIPWGLGAGIAKVARGEPA